MMIGRWARGYAGIAGVIGLLLVGALFSGAVVLQWDSLTNSWRDDPWRMVLFGFAAAPFATALLAAVAAAERPVLRASLLVAATSMAFLTMLLTALTVGFVLFPLVVLLLLAMVLAVGWEFTKYADGTTTRESVPYSTSGSASGTVDPGVVEVGQTCSSDVVTAREGAAGIAFLAAGVAAVAFATRPSGGANGNASAATRRSPAVTRG